MTDLHFRQFSFIMLLILFIFYVCDLNQSSQSINNFSFSKLCIYIIPILSLLIYNFKILTTSIKLLLNLLKFDFIKLYTKLILF